MNLDNCAVSRTAIPKGNADFDPIQPLRFTSLGICSAEHSESGLSGSPSRTLTRREVKIR